MDRNDPALPLFENELKESGLPNDDGGSRADPFKKLLERIGAVNKETLLCLMLGLLGAYSAFQQGKISSLEKDKSNMSKELAQEKNKPVWKKIYEDVVGRFQGTSAAVSK